jgi:hypothetical protein
MTQPEAVARVWDWRVPRPKADAYLELMERVALPDYRAGLVMLTRRAGRDSRARSQGTRAASGGVTSNSH